MLIMSLWHVFHILSFKYTQYFIFSAGLKHGISRKDEIYNKLVENFFNARNLDFPRASSETDGGYFAQVIFSDNNSRQIK